MLGSLPGSVTGIYGGILDLLWSLHPVIATVITIAVSVVFFRKLLKSRNPSPRQDFVTPQPQLIDQNPNDEHFPDISIPVQVPTTPRPQSVDHFPGDGKSPTTPEPCALEDRDTGSRETRDNKASISIAPPTIVDSPREVINEGKHVIPIPMQMLPLTSEHPLIDRGGGDVQSRGAGNGDDPDFPISTKAGDRVVPIGDAPPSMSFFQGSSNVNINNSDFNQIHGNATIIRFGDGQFTDVQRDLICDYIANLTVLPEINDDLKKQSLTQSIINLPRAEAVFNDYQNKKKSGPCFKGTREILLREMADWFTSSSESRMYVLSGLAGIGKSTVAYTIAARTAALGLLGASFFFSRDEADRRNAKYFFTTIAYQLCVFDEAFAKAIGDVLQTKRGSAAITKDPQEQLQVLIVDPLRSIAQSRTRPILIVVDALDECDEDGEHVVMGLSQLIRLLPSFKVILTTRPQPLVDCLFGNDDDHNIFHLQDIEDRVVDGDIRLYLSHSLSQEQVRARLLNPKEDWCASDANIEFLVRIAGRLFVIASTAVLFVLNKRLGDPGARMKKLLDEFAQDHTPFRALDDFYSIIVRSAIQVDNDDDDDDDVVDRYQVVLGTIVVIQTPLPIATLACFIGEEPKKIYAMLRYLQSVILLGADDVPRIYHKSFPDYITDQKRCRDSRLRIDPRIRHTQIAVRCFKIMDELLKYNILDLCDAARFMNNEDGLREHGTTDEHLQEKIPQQLRYACQYWANHLAVANIEDADLMNGLTKFVNKHMLHWIEVLSLIGELDLAHLTIRVALELLGSASSDLHQLLSDGLRFISMFYELIKQSALHVYCSALPFTPTNSLLYRRYIKEAVPDICGIDGGLEKWDALVANLSHGEDIGVIKFSLDSAFLVTCSEEYVDHRIRTQRRLKIWDAVTGTPISTISGHKFAVANDFSTVASSEDNTVTFYSVNGSAQNATFTTSSSIQKLALSSESSRVAAALYNGTIWLWDSRRAELINTFDGFEGSLRRPQLQFSTPGTRLAFSSANGIVKLLDGISGRYVADLECGSGHDLYFIFSGNGSRIASRSCDYGLTLWDSESGELIGAVRDVGGVRYGVGSRGLAISADGSLLATSEDTQVNLWSGNCDPMTQVEVLDLKNSRSMAFSVGNILAIATDHGIIKLYNVTTHSFISTLPFIRVPIALAFSPDCTHLAAGNDNGRVCLWDIQGIEASGSSTKGQATRVVALALSRDCSRLACGFDNGVVELWETSPTKRRIASHRAHTGKVTALGFGPDGGLFTSGSANIKLWNGVDGALRATLKAPSGLRAVAVSNSVLAAGWDGGVTLWTVDTLSLIHTFEKHGGIASAVSIAENSALAAAVFRHSRVSLLDVLNRTTIGTFDIPSWIHTITFLPDNSRLIVRCHNHDIYSIDLTNKRVVEGATLDYLAQLPNISFWHGVPIWYDKKQHCLGASSSQHKAPVPVLWLPRDLPVMEWTQGSSMIALYCDDARIILLRLPTSHVR